MILKLTVSSNRISLSVCRIAYIVLRITDFWFKNGGSARSYAQVLKKREKKEEKGLKKEEKLQEIKKKREKMRKRKHFCRDLKISEKKLARMSARSALVWSSGVRRWATDT